MDILSYILGKRAGGGGGTPTEYTVTYADGSTGTITVLEG